MVDKAFWPRSNRALNLLTGKTVLMFLPLIAALLLESANQFLNLQLDAGTNVDFKSTFLVIAFQLFIESLPLFGAHYLVIQEKKPKTLRIVIWIVGFLLYPLLSWGGASQLSGDAQWGRFGYLAWGLVAGASLSVLLLQKVRSKESWQRAAWLKHLLSLDSAVVVTLLVWAAMMAGIFLNEVDPMRNQPLPMKIDFSLVIGEFSRFISYAWQFSLLGLCAASIFVFNRYVLVKRLLAEQGVFVFVCGALITILVVTPVFAQIILAMPINVPEQTLLPSEDHNPFAPMNYQVVFWILVFTTPVILAFERQQQGKVLAQAVSERTQSELQLLQQQINPHFLFNTLNNLYALTLEKSDKAPEMVLKLSELLRYTTYEGQKELVPLTQELEYIQNYIDLQKLRFGEQLELQFDFPDDHKHWALPPLLLIILVENAFKHGAEKMEGSNELTIKIQIESQTLTMICTNSIPSGYCLNESGLGLANLKRRLHILQPKSSHLDNKIIEGNKWQSQLVLEMTNVNG